MDHRHPAFKAASRRHPSGEEALISMAILLARRKTRRSTSRRMPWFLAVLNSRATGLKKMIQSMGDKRRRDGVNATEVSSRASCGQFVSCAHQHACRPNLSRAARARRRLRPPVHQRRSGRHIVSFSGSDTAYPSLLSDTFLYPCRTYTKTGHH